MKIKKLLIYGFGKHENVTVELDSGMNVLYGLNEAGKTTIQQFILHILFGFPQRNSAVLRYEPKSGGKYGGQIILVDDHYGECAVERVRGKSAGDVTVYFPDGTSGGEESLNLLLRQYDRTSFESIFSFSLLQLQGFERMSEEELSRTLLASGTTGVDSLLQLEKNMEKEMGELFKKTGKNPQMNVKIKELRHLEIALVEEIETVKLYEPAVKRIRDIEKMLSQLEEKGKELRNGMQHLSLLRQYMPIYKKKIEVTRRIELVETVDFPADGIRRFESFVAKLAEMKALKYRIEDEVSELQTRIPKNERKERLTAIERLLAKESEWHGWVSQITFLETEIQRLRGLKHRLFDRLGMKLQQAEILFEADVSIRKEEEMFELINEIESVNKQMELVQSRFLIIEDELKEATLKLETFVKPTVEEVERAKEWPEIRQQFAKAEAVVSLGNEQKNESKFFPMIMIILAILLAIFGIIQQQWLITVAGVMIGTVGAYLVRSGSSTHDSKVKEMENFMAKYQGQADEMEQLLSRIHAYDYERKQFEQTIENGQIKLTHFQSERRNLKSKSDKVGLLYGAFIESLGFDGLPSHGIVPQLFQMIREVQEVERDLVRNQQQFKNVESLITERITEAEIVLERTVPQDVLYELVRHEYKQVSEEAERAEMVKEQISRLQPQLNETVRFISELENHVRALKDEAGTETEEDFYRAYDVYQEGVRLQEQLSDLTIQLELSGCMESLEKHVDTDFSKLEADNTAELAVIEEQSTALVHEKAKLINQTDRLLTDESFGEKRQVFEMKKAELANLAKKWAARKSVAVAIQRTMMELKEEKLPSVLTDAEKLFQELTGGNYEALRVTDEGFFVAVAANGMRYPIIELSQATKEQAYISLRLALASSNLDSAPFPILMDDPFVHFDDERLSRMIKLLQTSSKHQFIYFTCHKKMKEKWDDARIINVADIGNDQKEFIQ